VKYLVILPDTMKLRRMYTELVNDALTEYSYDASLAGLDYSFGSYDRGVFLASSGYNEKVWSRFSQRGAPVFITFITDPHLAQDCPRDDENNQDRSGAIRGHQRRCM